MFIIYLVFGNYSLYCVIYYDILNYRRKEIIVYYRRIKRVIGII